MTTDDGLEEDPTVPFTATNIASGQASVNQQVGFIGLQVVHEAPNYQSAGDSPQELFRLARAYLDGGAFTEAADRISEVMARGYCTAQVAYYWALAVLRGRPFEHLENEDYSKLHRAFAERSRHPMDEWTRALHVVEQLVQCLVSQVRDGELDTVRFDEVLDAYHRLPTARREEIDRHLGTMLPGAMQDRRDAELAEVIKARRMDNGRQRRVPLFFEPDPAEPHPVPPRPRETTGRQYLMAVGGIVLIVLGDLAAARAAATSNLLVSILGVALCLGGAAGAVPLALRWRYLALRRAARQREAAGVPSAAPPPDPAMSTARPEFVTELDQILHRRFAAAFADPTDASAIGVAAARKGLLRTDILDHYPPPPQANQLDWLVRWHADRAAQAWRSTAPMPPALPRPAQLAQLGMSVLAWAGGVAALLATAHHSRLLAVTGTILMLLGLRMAAAGAPVHHEWRRVREDGAALEMRYRQEQNAYRQELIRLMDRPDDREMARWLDYDKDYIRTRTMKHYTLKSTDVISYFILTEAWPGCVQARVTGGPQRYAVYRVRLFLLTDNGIREIELALDFASGAENSEGRRVFRYDAIASVLTTPRTVRRHGRRQIASIEGGGPADRPPRPILRHDLRVTLLNGHNINIKTDYDPLLAEEQREDPAALHQLMEDTTGANNALLILESVAAEGRDWIRREKERIRSKAAEYQHTDIR
jgi:hypothetical protein